MRYTQAIYGAWISYNSPHYHSRSVGEVITAIPRDHPGKNPWPDDHIYQCTQ
jgi:hypothetical protein